MLWQHDGKEQSGEGPATAREVVKQFLHDYVLLDWTPEQLPKRARGQSWDTQIGGEASDEAGQPQTLSNEQIAITRLQDRPHFAVFELSELIAEIRREEGLEPEDAPRCAFCGAVARQPTKGPESALL